jgi:ribonucleoside-diphosphate reductase alpha chain
MDSEVDLTLARRTVKNTLDVLNDEFGEGVKVPRYTTVKPAGHTSLLLGTSSGIHSYPAPYYLRRITIAKSSRMGQYLKKVMPTVLLEEDVASDNNYKLVVPMRAPLGAGCQTDEGEAFTMLDRIKHINETWVSGLASEQTTISNNISATVSVPEDIEDEVISKIYNGLGYDHKGITVLRQSGHRYAQPVWEPVTETVYNAYLSAWPMFMDVTMIVEMQNNTELSGEMACTAGGCEIR